MALGCKPYIEKAKGKPLPQVLREHQRAGSEVPLILEDLDISRDTLKRYLDDHGGRVVRTIWLPDNDA